jgi:hypothetical protein
MIGREQDTGAAHIDRAALTGLVRALLAENFVADFALNGESIRTAAIGFLCGVKQ